jgi:hypothetical protein
MRLRLFACLLLVLCAALPAAAQDAPPEATAETTDARAFVEQALASFAELPSYHFAYGVRMEATFSMDEPLATTATISSVEGDALANGDNFVSILFATAETLELAEATPPLIAERTVFNGKSALNFELEDTIYEGMFPFEDGWQSYDDMIAASNGDLSTQAGIDTVNNAALPGTLFADSAFIQSVTERDPETIDGVELRVFAVEYDAVGLMLTNTPAEQRPGLQELLQSLDLIATSDLTATTRLWIGADDTQIYRAQFSYTSNIPYYSSGHTDMAPYDISTVSNAELSISRHGEPVEIVPVVLPE